MLKNTPLALLPLITGMLVLVARFHGHEGAMSIFGMGVMLASTRRAAADRQFDTTGSGDLATLPAARVWRLPVLPRYFSEPPLDHVCSAIAVQICPPGKANT
jgi:hypothetical protein